MNKVVKEILNAAFTNNINAIAKTHEDNSVTYHFSFLEVNKVINSLFDIAAIRFSQDQVNVYLYDGHNLEDETNIEILHDDFFYYTRPITDKDAVLILDIINANEDLIIEIHE